MVIFALFFFNFLLFSSCADEKNVPKTQRSTETYNMSNRTPGGINPHRNQQGHQISGEANQIQNISSNHKSLKQSNETRSIIESLTFGNDFPKFLKKNPNPTDPDFIHFFQKLVVLNEFSKGNLIPQEVGYLRFFKFEVAVAFSLRQISYFSPVRETFDDFTADVLNAIRHFNAKFPFFSIENEPQKKIELVKKVSDDLRKVFESNYLVPYENSDEHKKWFLECYDFLNDLFEKKYSHGQMELKNFIDFSYRNFITLLTTLQRNQKGLACVDILNINFKFVAPISFDPSFDDDDYEEFTDHHVSNSNTNNANLSSFNLLDELRDHLLNKILENIMNDTNLIEKMISNQELMGKIDLFLNDFQEEMIKDHKINQDNVAAIFTMISNFIYPPEVSNSADPQSSQDLNFQANYEQNSEIVQDLDSSAVLDDNRQVTSLNVSLQNSAVNEQNNNSIISSSNAQTLNYTATAMKETPRKKKIQKYISIAAKGLVYTAGIVLVGCLIMLFI